MKVSRSFSDQNVFCSYVCLVSGVKPSDYENPENPDITYNASPQAISTGTGEGSTAYEDIETPIQVERSKALHELVTCKNDKPKQYPQTVNEATTNVEVKESGTDCVPNPNILKLTKMKWLTEDQENASNSSSASVSSSSNSSLCSKESEGSLSRCINSCDKCLSTILRLDKEHNMFGLSNIAIVGAKISRKSRKESEKPAFPQTAIIQVCCGKRCCKHKSNTDLPVSLKVHSFKASLWMFVVRCLSFFVGLRVLLNLVDSGWRNLCAGCHSSCYDPYCPTCTVPKALPWDGCPSNCSSFAKIKYKVPCLPSKCLLDCCNGRGGMKIFLKRKPTYEPSPMELTPRSSSILQKPQAARSCHHTPQCIPPSSCFPYLLPCYWPARPGAPCSHPSSCFHNPPCRAPRQRKTPIPLEEMCPKEGPCVVDKNKCPNPVCPGNNPNMKGAIESRFGKAMARDLKS